MFNATKIWRRLFMLLVVVGFAGTAYAQRTVTLRLNTATIADTINTDSFIEVRGAVKGNSPVTLFDGNVIDWSDVSTLEPTNVGGDYWDIDFQIADTTDLTFKFYSQQAQDSQGEGWEADPNPNIPPGSNDTTLVVHYFESGREYRGVTGNRGDYDWRPYEEKEDTVAVWFRVFMNTESASARGYDRTDDSQVVGVRGDNLDINGDGSVTGPLDWGATLPLDPESENVSVAGYHLYSGVAYYPKTLAGQTQAYKFFIEPSGWEDAVDNRTFTIPQQDTTLYWQYFDNSPPVSVQPVESLLIFTVDLTPFEEIGVFDQARGDTLWTFGDFNGWQDCPDATPDACLMAKIPGEQQFELATPLTRIPGAQVAYKYFLDFNNETFMDAFGVEPPSGWEEGHLTGINRFFDFQDQPQQATETEYFNDVQPGNVIPDGTSIDVSFSVDMSPALANDARPFDPASDEVFIEVSDPIWAFTQNLFPEEGQGDFPHARGFLTDDDGDNVYTGTFTVNGPTYSNLTFKYGYGPESDNFIEPGGDTNTPGRRRTYFVQKNADGSWPTAYALPDHTFQVEAGPLPYEQNPEISTAIEDQGGELPAQITLGQNYPNPFNPSTSFEYSLSSTQRVTVRVYDLLGRAVATIVDGVQTASTYRVTFDASNLASGMYIYQLETPTKTLSKTMILVK